MKYQLHTLVLFRILTIAAAVVLSVGFAGCREEKTYKIGISQCSSDDWRSKANDEIMREAMMHENVTVEIRSADDSSAKQIEDIRYFADNGFDIIVAAPNEADSMTPIIKEVYERGIPVVIFDRDIHGDSYTARIYTDNEAIGREAGEYAARIPSRTGGKGPKALELYGLQGSTPAADRHRGFAEAFTGRGGEIVGSGYGRWNQEDAVPQTDSLLRLYPDVDVIFAHNDRMAIGASEVATRMGLRDRVKIIGIDAAPSIGIRAVADSVIDATFLYPTEGHLLLKTAIAILEKKPFDREHILPASSPVDLTNADILLLQDQSLQSETAKMRELKQRIDTYWERHSAQTAFSIALGVILFLVTLSLFLVLRAYWQRQRYQATLMSQNRQLEEQSAEQKRLNEELESAINSKMAFYTNVSHDLRTPLSLIAEPVSQLSAANNLTERQHTLAQLADKNVKILQRLINQILDFRKLESGKLKFKLREVDFSAAIREWTDSFLEVARQRDIKLSLTSPMPDDIRLALDPEMMERVFFNLISNAIKYTRDNGSINVSYAVEGDKLVVKVADTGIGIPQEDLPNIFDRFFRVKEAMVGGSGIGLSLVKAFVELHGGEISVESTVGKGSVFTVSIPVKHIEEEAIVPQKLISAEEVSAELRRVEKPIAQPEEAAAQDGDRATVLVVDDNADIRMLVEQLLCDNYDVHQASNGREGLAKAIKLVPDLVICDIMMPVMDGLECCRKLKEEVTTSHIPVLMLTACALDRQRMEGYDSGADGYISKPFSAEMLRSRVRNLIANRKRIKDLWGNRFNVVAPAAATSTPAAGSAAGSGSAQASGSAPGSGSGPASKDSGERKVAAPVHTVGNVDPDNEFYAKFLQIFEKEISNPNLNIELLASQMGLGHSQFYRKIKALTNYTPVELLRQLRLKRARHLLKTTDRSISEIAYEVGFSSPAYFTRCYKEQFSETPTELRDRIAPN